MADLTPDEHDGLERARCQKEKALSLPRATEQYGGTDKAEGKREKTVVKVGQPDPAGKSNRDQCHDCAQRKEGQRCPLAGPNLGAHDRNHDTRLRPRSPGFSLYLLLQG